MKVSSIEQLEFHNVHMSKSKNEAVICIHFKLDWQEFFVRIVREDHVYVPHEVLHEEKQRCVVCDDGHNSYVCSFLNKSKNNVFQKLIEFPNIRLEWLFIPYEA